MNCRLKTTKVESLPAVEALESSVKSWTFTRRLGYVICPKTVFVFAHSCRKIRHVIHGGSKVRFDTPCLRRFRVPVLFPLGGFSLVAGSQSRQKL
ncbi:hypothetical protein AVEN_230353-1 [Araneus ventricosus]|uniref:Uncharacterized protein n=1 Tax=Araneus ventricosus TaxID=182803 RepID=A0A4Y2I555_ARAVE|nr:hypothetical protein AVEN_230353-1 [Araneus ventricosus]